MGQTFCMWKAEWNLHRERERETTYELILVETKPLFTGNTTYTRIINKCNRINSKSFCQIFRISLFLLLLLNSSVLDCINFPNALAHSFPHFLSLWEAFCFIHFQPSSSSSIFHLVVISSSFTAAFLHQHITISPETNTKTTLFLFDTIWWGSMQTDHFHCWRTRELGFCVKALVQVRVCLRAVCIMPTIPSRNIKF